MGTPVESPAVRSKSEGLPADSTVAITVTMAVPTVTVT